MAHAGEGRKFDARSTPRESRNMKLRLYIKPNVIGLSFANRDDRDLFWSRLGKYQVSAEKFGERTVRLHPDKAKAGFHFALASEVRIESLNGEVKTAPAPVQPKPVEKTIPAAAIRAPEPIPAIATVPVEVLESGAVAAPVAKEIDMPMPEPPPAINMPQVASVLDPEPADKRTKEWKAWNMRQKK